MNETAFDTVTTNVAAISRRASLFTLGGAAFTAIVRPAGSEAAKKPK